MDELYQVDRLVHEAINSRAIPGFGDFFLAVTQFGSAALWTAAFVVYLILGKKKLVATMFILVLLFGTVINEDLKDIIHRQRPEGAVVGAYISPYNYSFPSQHSQTAFMLATLVAAYFGWRYGLITYPFAALIALSRMYLGVHYLTDVIGGALIGIAIAELAILAMNVNGMSKNSGVFGYLLRLAGIRPPETPVPGGQKVFGLMILMLGIALSAVAMLLQMYITSLAFVTLTYVLVILLPHLYDRFKPPVDTA